jgi:hypothetical protein
MTLDEFRESLTAEAPPKTVAPLLAALWWDAKGDWGAAHGLAQDIENEDGAWVHAYLHRKEGDASNAGYWYRRARRPHSHASLQDEWQEITTALLSHDG